MKPVLLFHEDLNMETVSGRLELDVAREHVPTIMSRVDATHNLVIPRFGLLPFYKEMERDLAKLQSRLINSYEQHRWIANFTAWGGQNGVLHGLTPASWTNWHSLPEGMSFVVKGRTNSRKDSWSTRMFAKTRDDVPAVAARLFDEQLIMDQGLIVREFVPLKKLGEGLNGLPVSNEWRTFWCATPREVSLLGVGYYWAASHPETIEKAKLTKEGLRLAFQAAESVAPHVSFFVIDIAEKEEGGWTVIEVNDAQMSGLCGVPAETFYRRLARVFRRINNGPLQNSRRSHE